MKWKATDENENEDVEGKGGGGRAKKHADVLDGKVRGVSFAGCDSFCWICFGGGWR